MSLSQAEIAALVDAAAYKDGQKQANPAKWMNVGTDGSAAWGEIQGSAKEPYRVCIDLNDSKLASKCTCPSRKFPCKHAVGLALVVVGGTKTLPTAAPPPHVQAWMGGRASRAMKKAEAVEGEAAAPKAPAKPKAASTAARDKKVTAGMADLRLRLRDLVRRGLSDERLTRYLTWDEMAKRMMDAQAGEVANRLRELGGQLSGKGQNAPRLLDEIARLYLLTEVSERLPTLPPALQADIRAQIGYTTNRDEVLTGEPVRDTWTVMGQTTENTVSLLVRRVWLHGAESGRWALLLEYAPKQISFGETFLTGESFAGEVVYYASAFPQRALIKRRADVSSLAMSDMQMRAHFAHAGFGAALASYADALALNPWVERVPVALASVYAEPSDDATLLYDADGWNIPLSPVSARSHRWTLLSASGGGAFPLFGEWDGVELRPLMIYSDSAAFAFS
jgi:hypothetical protein